MLDLALNSTEVKPTPLEDLADRIAARAGDWHCLTNAAKLGFLRRLFVNLEEVAEEWVEITAVVHGGDPDGGDEASTAPAWMAGVVPTASTLHGLIRSYEGLVRDGRIPAPPSIRTRPDGQVVATVSPASLKDRGFAPGTRGELWLEPGQGATQGAALRESRPGVCLILGAGNYEAPLDVLSRLFVHGRVVIYKPNPVNELQLPILERLLEPLITAGFLALAPSDTDTAQQLIHHPAVDEVFMTGSQATYDRIVWGPRDQQEANKKAGRRQMTKPFEAELGGVSPAIVVPGEWTDKELDHQAAQLAAAKMLNAGHICSSLQVIVLSRGWAQREAFLQRVLDHWRSHAAMRPYYPGAAERQATFAEHCATAERLTAVEPVEGSPELVFIPDALADNYALHEEAFGSVLAVATLDVSDPAAFLRRATRFCNDELYGTLSASLLVDPRTSKRLGGAVEDSVADLRYGSIGVNTWGGMLFFQGELAWGAHPGHTPEDIQSGVGLLNNTYLLDGVQKAVQWTPFVSPSHVQPEQPADAVVYPRIGRYTLHPTWGNLSKLLFGVMTGR
jgi:acyl-CoA reductase-like NAD-dependent aldehyde dehydrogenase